MICCEIYGKSGNLLEKLDKKIPDKDKKILVLTENSI